MVRLLIVNDDALVRAGLRMILESADDLEVVGEAADGAEVVTAVQRHHPDVVLMDIRMPRMDGLSATTGVRALPGLSNHEIGASRYLSEATVKAHVSRLLVKLDAANRAQVAILAHEAGLLD